MMLMCKAMQNCWCGFVCNVVNPIINHPLNQSFGAYFIYVHNPIKSQRMGTMAYPISKHISIGDAASCVIRARPSHVKDIIDGKLDKRKKGTFGPPFGKRRGVSHMAFCYDGGTPIAGWFIMEHPKIDDLGFPPHFRNLHLE
jgi:hypothetical protein